MQPVWIIDDDKSIRWVIEKSLSREGIVFRSFSAAQDALDALEDSSPQAVISDIRMPGASGLEFMQKLKAKLPGTPDIIMTAYSDLESAVAAFQGGAFEYLPKPFDIDHAVELIRRALDESVRKSPSEDIAGNVPEILGSAPTMQEVFRAIGRLSQSHATVLITGESGTGKELVALALHRHSPRAVKPFIAINTAAIPKDLLESELFGHERGAFTGAAAMRRGRFEQADGGTLFLDEIGDMPPELQTRLLRVLADGQFYRVGGHTPITANVRVIAATHQDLDAMIAAQSFREDLYYRLAEIVVKIPSLAERPGDAVLLARHFTTRFARELNPRVGGLGPDALAAIDAYPWPGNVRELENRLKRAVIMADGKMVGAADLDLPGGPASEEESSIAINLRAAREVADRRAIRQAMTRTENNISGAAKLLGISRPTLYDLLKQYHLQT